jgi:hypothetical protein
MDRGTDPGSPADAADPDPWKEGACDPICASEDWAVGRPDDATGEVFHVGGDGFEYR